MGQGRRIYNNEWVYARCAVRYERVRKRNGKAHNGHAIERRRLPLLSRCSEVAVSGARHIHVFRWEASGLSPNNPICPFSRHAGTDNAATPQKFSKHTKALVTSLGACWYDTATWSLHCHRSGRRARGRLRHARKAASLLLLGFRELYA